ncbi:MAG: sigma-70 family RNA polymerase sigma factor [Steroidobacteraceae bacterium]
MAIDPGHIPVTAIFTSTTEWDLDLSRPAFTLRGQGHNAVRSRYGSHQANGLPVMDHAVGKREFVGFQALCQKLRPDLLRFAYWLCHDHALAEDVVQESMLRAWKAQDSLQDEKAAKPWLLTIVRRELARTFERKRLTTVNVDDLIAQETPSLAAGGDQDDLEEMRAAIFTLPVEYREPLVMQALLGYSTGEIASELKLSLPAVLTRLFRARQQLRRLCGEDTGEDPPA